MKGTSPGLFVTGTGTGVGKTMVTSLLGAILEKEGFDFGVFKPVQTGLIRNKCPDLETYRCFFKLPDSEKEIIPVRLKAPQAPAIAAQLEKRAIQIEKILQTFYILKQRHVNMLIEGVGGLMVPLTTKIVVADFLKTTGLPALLVAGTELGTINHTCLTAAFLRQKRIPCAGIIFSRVRAKAAPLQKRVVREIERISGMPILGCIPEFNVSRTSVQKMVAQTEASLDLKSVLSYFRKSG